MKKQHKYSKTDILDINNQQDPNIDDSIAFMDEQPNLHTPETIKARCESLLKDSQGIIRGLRIVGILNPEQYMCLQMGSYPLHNRLMDYLSEMISNKMREDMAEEAGEEPLTYREDPLTREDVIALCKNEDSDEKHLNPLKQKRRGQNPKIRKEENNEQKP